MTTILSQAIPFNLSPIEIVLHLVNFAILFTAMFLLLYKPVKKFIAKRQEYFENLEKTGKERAAEADNLKKEYHEKLTAVDEEIAEKKQAAEREWEAKSREVVEEANRTADKMIAEAEEVIAKDKQKAVSELRKEIADVAVEIASGILAREITVADNDKLVDESINEWRDKKNG